MEIALSPVMAKTTKSKRNWVVVCDRDAKGAPVYVGELDCGRQGVRKLENATRFTHAGALRVVAGYPDAILAGRAWAQEVAS